jgi:deoxyribodipyrimidine photo-lyase
VQVYSPYWRNWIDTLNGSLDEYIEESPKPLSNPESIRQDKKLSPLFKTPVPDTIEGFELDENDSAKMEEYWPAGESAAKQVPTTRLKSTSCLS